MKFRTEVEINESRKKIGIEDCIFSIGSCFATEMHEKFSQGQIQSLNNPFGTIFNPFSIFQAIQQIYDAKEYQEKDLILANENYISLDHHSSFDSRYAHKSLEKINQNITNKIYTTTAPKAYTNCGVSITYKGVYTS